MDIERTMEFIMDMQAKAEVRAAKAEARMDKSDERMDKFDRRLDAIRKLIETGMRILAKSQKDSAEFHKKFEEYKIESKRDFDRRIKEISDIQKGTDLKLDRLIDSWGKQRTNGHPGRKKPE